MLQSSIKSLCYVVTLCYATCYIVLHVLTDHYSHLLCLFQGGEVISWVRNARINIGGTARGVVNEYNLQIRGTGRGH